MITRDFADKQIKRKNIIRFRQISCDLKIDF